MGHLHSLVRSSSVKHSVSNKIILLALVATWGIVGLVLGIVFDEVLGEAIVLLTAIIAVSRLPLRWMPAVLAGSWLFLLLVQAHHSFTRLSGSAAWLDIIRGISLFIFVTGILVLLRSRQQTLEELRATQARLTTEMARTAQLAASRERARIARDLHDILAHSLTVISVQVQAARSVVATTPEEVPGKLDTIAQLVRESIAESRRVVSLLREQEAFAATEGTFRASVRDIAEHFTERTGVRCVVEEQGAIAALTPPHEEALHYAAQEALTNAYRHGQAKRIDLNLTWHTGTVTLSIHDNGAATAQHAHDNAGGNGLRGMRERAEALGGSMKAGPAAGGGFTVAVTLPTAVSAS